MAKPIEIPLAVVSPDRLAPIIGPERMRIFVDLAESVRDFFTDRNVYNISSTAQGGGVAEMVVVLLAYVQGLQISNHWLVIEGNLEFFETTKRLHNLLHGTPGNGGELGADQRNGYESVLADNADDLETRVKEGDIVLLHDPQTAGLAVPMKKLGATVLWRCHIGTDEANDYVRKGWDFLEPYLADVDLFIFSRPDYVPGIVDMDRTHIIQPSLDPFSSKNLHMAEDQARAIMVAAGLATGTPVEPAIFTRTDGKPGEITRKADVVEVDSIPIDAPLVVQVSRWDGLKDMEGVLNAFAKHVHLPVEAHLLLAGPAVAGVTDDPEGLEIYQQCVGAWESLDKDVRARVHLACVPMDDREENAAIINAIQTHANVVTQKSLAEGFGLTVTEAMWKGKPIVASAVGGILEQITDGRHGLLIRDPSDLKEFGAAVQRLLTDPVLADQLGANARYRAMGEFLGDRHLAQYGRLIRHIQQLT